MSYQLALCSRVISRGPDALVEALDWGITVDDFTTLEARQIWSLVLAYYEQEQTKGSVVDKPTFERWFDTVSLQTDMPNYTLDALCFEVRRDRIVVEANSAIVRYSQEANTPTCDPVGELVELQNTVQKLLGLGTSASPRLLSGANLASHEPDPEYLVEGTALVAGGSGGPHLVAGYGGTGKTMMVQSLAISLAAHMPAWGRYTVPRSYRVLHLDLDGQGIKTTKRRYQRLAHAMGVDLAALGSPGRGPGRDHARPDAEARGRGALAASHAGLRRGDHRLTPYRGRWRGQEQRGHS